MELPPTVRADITRWSHQIDRLTLEADQGRLLLRSPHPLVLTAVRRHRTLGPASPANVILSRWHCGPTPIRRWSSPSMPVALPSWTACPAGGSRRGPQRCRLPTRAPCGAAPACADGAAAGSPREGRRQRPQPCQATTQAGRPCTHRARPASRCCRVHAAWSPQARSRTPVHAPGAPGQPSPRAHARNRAGDAPTAGRVPGRRPQGLGLCTWLLSLLLMRLSGGARSLALPAWVVAGLALVGTCGLVGWLGHGWGWWRVCRGSCSS